MRYFLDTEFNGFGGELIALAAVPESNEFPPFYEAIECLSPVPWAIANILPVLQTNPKPRTEVARLFCDYLASDGEPLLLADWPEDIAHAASMLTNSRGGRLFKEAVRFELLPASDFASKTRSAIPHNAYYDALALREWVLSSA